MRTLSTKKNKTTYVRPCTIHVLITGWDKADKIVNPMEHFLTENCFHVKTGKGDHIYPLANVEKISVMYE